MKKISMFLTVLTMMLMLSVSASAATYYVSNNGNDTNDGLSENSAWRTIEKVNQTSFSPGDKILFESGGIWNGSLWMRNSGESGNPIEIGKYAEGAKPVINGCGANATVLLYNQQYVKIKDLEITNMGEEAHRYGVYVAGYDAGALHGIELRNLTIHDINGAYTYAAANGIDNHWNGGIVVSARGDIATRFVGMTITGCNIYDVARSGIVMWSNYFTAFDKQIAGMSQQLQITNNTVHHTKGDGIIVVGDYKGLVSGNTVYETNLMSYTGEKTAANVGIFVMHSTGTVVRENESYLSRTQNDGFGYDIDGDNDDVVFEYNYSHDNEGGFLLIVNHQTYNAVARYNISVNDKHQSLAFAAFNVSESLLQSTAKVYNNTIYSHYYITTGKHIQINSAGASPKLVEIYNNIFDINVRKVITATSWLMSDKVVVSNNMYSGNDDVEELASGDSAPVYGSPNFVNPSLASIGFEGLEGLYLADTSPCIGAGIIVEDNGGFDFFGNPVSQVVRPNIGAYEGA